MRGLLYIYTVYIVNWKRFLGDCFLIWKNSLGSIDNLTNILYDLNPDIKFTIEHSPDKLPFLDVLLNKNDGKIITDIYHKPTDATPSTIYLSIQPIHAQLNLISPTISRDG